MLRPVFRVLAVAGAILYSLQNGCTTLLETTGLIKGPTLLYGGSQPSYFEMNCGIALWSSAALLFCNPIWVATDILAIGGLNLVSTSTPRLCRPNARGRILAHTHARFPINMAPECLFQTRSPARASTFSAWRSAVILPCPAHRYYSQFWTARSSWFPSSASTVCCSRLFGLPSPGFGRMHASLAPRRRPPTSKRSWFPKVQWHQRCPRKHFPHHRLPIHVGCTDHSCVVDDDALNRKLSLKAQHASSALGISFSHFLFLSLHVVLSRAGSPLCENPSRSARSFGIYLDKPTPYGAPRVVEPFSVRMVDLVSCP